MCNAKNHRWNCNCGFGRAGQPVETAPAAETQPSLFAPPRVPRYYAKSNARCPFCDAAVFFYNLVNDGRVYFDSIGPPWPKHPCTDKSSEFNTGATSDGGGKWPMLKNVVVKTECEIISCLSGMVQGENVVIFVRCDAFGTASTPPINLSDSFIQARLRLDGSFDIALLTPELRSILIKGYGTATEAKSEKQ